MTKARKFFGQLIATCAEINSKINGNNRTSKSIKSELAMALDGIRDVRLQCTRNTGLNVDRDTRTRVTLISHSGVHDETSYLTANRDAQCRIMRFYYIRHYFQGYCYLNSSSSFGCLLRELVAVKPRMHTLIPFD